MVVRREFLIREDFFFILSQNQKSDEKNMTLFKKSEVEKTDNDSQKDRYIKRVLLTELIAQSENKKNKSVSDQIKLRNLKRTYSLLYDDSFYCPALATNLPKYEISRCIFCQSGHIGSCHYPFECSTPYCNNFAPKTQEQADYQMAQYILSKIEKLGINYIPRGREITELVKQSIDLGIYPPQLTELCDLIPQV